MPHSRSRHRLHALVMSIACLTIVVAPADAQWAASVDLGSAARRELPGEPTAYPARIDAALRYLSPFGTLTANAQAFSGFSRTTRSDVSFAADVESASWSRIPWLRLVVGVGSAGTRLAEGVRRDRVDVRGGLGVKLLDLDAVATATHAWFEEGAVTPTAAGAAIVVRRRFRNVHLSVGAQHVAYPDAFVALRETTYVVAGFQYIGQVERLESARRRYEELSASLGWTLGRSRADAAAGARGASQGIERERWARLSLEVPLLRRLALVGSVGRRMSSPEQRLPAYRFGSLALRLASTSAEGELVEPRRREAQSAPVSARLDVAGDGTLTLYGVSGARVELMGDFTDWLPVSLASPAAGRWRYAERLAAGIYHVVMRVDGGPWLPPPGLPVVTDDFETATGMLMVTR